MEKIVSQVMLRHKEAFAWLETQSITIINIAKMCIAALKAKRKIVFMGNGGSAADAQHLAAELVGRFKRQRRPLAGLALTTDTSILTAVGNDFGFDDIFVHQIEALASPADVLVALSTSGNSGNLVKGVEKAKVLQLTTVGFLGRDGGRLKSLVDIALIVPSSSTPAIQEMHILSGHIICELIDLAFSIDEEKRS